MIRKFFSLETSLNLTEVITKTKIVNTLATILRFKEDDFEEIYYMRLEALWIIQNISCSEKEEDI